MSRLSLESSSSSSQPGSHIRGRARGIDGLVSRGNHRGRGGRAGLAKRNLAALAPGGLPGVPISEQRPFGPQPGDVGTRSALNDAATSPSSSSVAPSDKPKSKLALLAEKRRAAAVAQGSSLQSPALANPSTPDEDQRATLSPTKRPSESQLPSEDRTSGSDPPTSSRPNTHSEPRPSKLVALAQGRKAHAQSNGTSSATSSAAPKAADAASGSTASSSKPLSKLQQRALAARQAREEKERNAKQTQEQAQSQDRMDVDQSVSAQAEEAAADQILPSGTAERALFPGPRSSGGSVAPHNMAKSDMGELLKSSTALTGGSDAVGSLPWLQPDDGVHDAFVGPSPDDKVLNARQATKLRR